MRLYPVRLDLDCKLLLTFFHASSFDGVEHAIAVIGTGEYKNRNTTTAFQLFDAQKIMTQSEIEVQYAITEYS